MRMKGWILGSLLSLIVGCVTTVTPPPPDPSPDDAGTFESDACKRSLSDEKVVMVGSGAGQYRDIVDNDILTWEKGPQGGHHIWVGVRMKGLRQSGTITEITVTDLQNPNQPVILTSRRVPFTYDADEGGFCVLKNIRAQLDEDVEIQTLQDHHVILEVKFTDRDGAEGEAQHFIQVQGPVDNG